MHKLIEASIFTAIGVLVFASLLMPVVSDAMTENGDPITLTNTSPIVLREAKAGDVLECVRTVTDGVAMDSWTLNGVEAIGPAGQTDAWNVGLLSDGIYIQVNGRTNSAVGQWYNITDSSPSLHYLSGGGNNGAHYGVEFTEDTITLYGAYGTESQTTIATVSYTWAYVVCPYANGEYCAPLSGGVGIVKNADQVILCGAYTTGDFDTMYYRIGGVDWVSNSSYEMNTNVTLALHENTTDIYDATVSVSMTDGDDTETFTPYRILVPYQVSGHATSGALYDMLGVLPIVVIVALILGVIGAAVYSRIE